MKNPKLTMTDKKMDQIINTFKFYIKSLPKNSINREILEETDNVIEILRFERTK